MQERTHFFDHGAGVFYQIFVTLEKHTIRVVEVKQVDSILLVVMPDVNGVID
jgi:hypothetical protein